MNLIDPQVVNNLSQLSIFPIIEFTSVSVIVIVTYLGLHGLFTHLKPATKMLLSMFLGTCAYTVGKLTLFAIIVNPFTSQPLPL